MIVIGSTALAYHTTTREPSDLDLVGTYEEVKAFKRVFQATSCYPINSGKTMLMRNASGKICEIEIAWPDSRAEKFNNWMEDYDNRAASTYDEESDWLVPSLNVLYMLKMSHRFLKDSPHFLKTMEDIWFMRRLGAVIQPEHETFYKQREKDTYTYAHPKLNTSKEGFFDAVATGVEYTYDHDSIHEAVKAMTKPAYTYFKPDQSEVMCSKDLFAKQPYVVKLQSVMEEAYVLAIERSLVPYPGGMTPDAAFKLALMKVCTSITSGWWREWAWEHYYEAADRYNDRYFDKFNFELSIGAVKPFDKSTATY